MKINYKKYGDYYLPDLALAEKKNKHLNKYGLLRLEYLKNHKKALYQELLMKDKLNVHLFSVSTEAENKVNYLINELIEFRWYYYWKIKSKKSNVMDSKNEYL